MIDLKKQEELFMLIGNRLKNKVECFVIGGSAMMYHGVKANTKDVDLVFNKESDKELVLNILLNSGYKERYTFLVYPKKKNVPILLELDESRIDLFSKKIICFELTESMMGRVTGVYEYGNFIVKLISPEDIILLKCATERAGDRVDAKAIIEDFKINWDILIQEALNQTKEEKEIFAVFLYEFLLELKEDLKVDIPKEALNKIGKIAEDELVKRLKKSKEKE